MITLKSCPVCESERIVKYKWIGYAPEFKYRIMPGVVVDATVIARYFVCQNCNLIFQNPRMSEKELIKFYSEGYYRKTLNSTEEENDIDEKLRAETDAKIIGRYVRKPKSHLDVGGSRGYFLKVVDADLKVNVESNVGYHKIKGIEIYPNIDNVPHKTFDLVTAIHVLEHAIDPLGYLRKMANLAGKSGFVVLEVPTWKSKGGPLRLAHLYHFEPSVLRHVCMLANLQIVHEEFTPHLLLICKKASS